MSPLQPAARLRQPGDPQASACADPSAFFNIIRDVEANRPRRREPAPVDLTPSPRVTLSILTGA